MKGVNKMVHCEYERINAIRKVESEEHKNRVQIEHPTENILKEVNPKENGGLSKKNQINDENQERKIKHERKGIYERLQRI